MTTIAYDQRAILIDGERTLLLSGAIHYPRSTPAMWPEMMRRSREAGLNTIETYVFWNLHEREQGVFDFSGRLDLMQFCRVAQEHGLHVILRIGPYICAEINYGGFPPWLRDVPGIQFRTLNEPFMREMERWVRLLCDYLRPMFVTNGGPIIMAQIENEYNLIAPTYGEEGQRYLAWSIELGQSLNLGIPWVMCVGGMPGAIETINGFYAHEMIDEHHKNHPDQPSLWTENWPGWYDVWGQPHHVRTPQNVAYGVARFIAAGGTGVNYYMWHGGTNFGREAMYLQTTSYDYTAPLDEFGMPTTKSNHVARLHKVLIEHADALLANERATPHVLGPQQAAWSYGNLTFISNDDPGAWAEVHFEGTSYRLSARTVLILASGKPIFNTSDLHPKDVIKRTMQPVATQPSYWSWHPEPLPAQRIDPPALTGAEPAEQLQLTHDQSDYCWYTTMLDVPTGQANGTLTLTAADYVYIYIDGKLLAQGPERLIENRSRIDGDTERLRTALEQRYGENHGYKGEKSFQLSFTLELAPGKHELAILCCALGMIKGDWQIGLQNMVDERKGLWGTVTWNGTPLSGPWQQWPLLAGERQALYGPAAELVPWRKEASDGKPLRWWRGFFPRPAGDQPLALDMSGMRKGIAWLNGRCIGRYWLIAGNAPSDPWFKGTIEDHGIGEPTQRYYHLPLEWLTELNELVLFEEESGDPGLVRLCYWMP